jgi:hypothetical protein
MGKVIIFLWGLWIGSVVFHYFKFGIFKKLFLCFWELSCWVMALELGYYLFIFWVWDYWWSRLVCQYMYDAREGVNKISCSWIIDWKPQLMYLSIMYGRYWCLKQSIEKSGIVQKRELGSKHVPIDLLNVGGLSRRIPRTNLSKLLTHCKEVVEFGFCKQASHDYLERRRGTFSVWHLLLCSCVSKYRCASMHM